jgi:hypothetical protein
VNTLGYHVKDIGTHSIRKGSASLVASLSGDPSAAAICIQAGWTMGKVCDQKNLIDNLMKHLDGMLDCLVDMGNGGMSVFWLTNLFNKSTQDLQEKIDSLAGLWG